MANSDSIWDDPEIRATGNYVKFDQPGDRVSGQIIHIGKSRFGDDGKLAPELFLGTDDGEEVVFTAGQADLKAQLVRERPSVGDHITVELDKILPPKFKGGKGSKLFTVVVDRA